MSFPLRIYVAGPLSADHEHQRQHNIDCAMDAGIAIIQRGHYPYVPHLSGYMDERAISRDILIEYEQWMALDYVWLDKCEALLYLGSSPGADRELKQAENSGKRVFYSLAEVPNVAEQSKGQMALPLGDAS